MKTLLKVSDPEGYNVADAHFTPALHLRSVYTHLNYARGEFPVAECLSERILCLPCHPHLSDEDVDQMVHALESIAQTVPGRAV